MRTTICHGLRLSHKHRPSGRGLRNDNTLGRRRRNSDGLLCNRRTDTVNHRRFASLHSPRNRSNLHRLRSRYCRRHRMKLETSMNSRRGRTRLNVSRRCLQYRLLFSRSERPHNGPVRDGEGGRNRTRRYHLPRCKRRYTHPRRLLCRRLDDGSRLGNGFCLRQNEGLLGHWLRTNRRSRRTQKDGMPSGLLWNRLYHARCMSKVMSP